MKSEELRKRLEDELVAAREKWEFWLAKREEIKAEMSDAWQYVERLEALLSTWDKSEAEGAMLPMFKDEGERHNRYEDLTIAGAAYEVLKEVNVPLHAKRILAAIVMGGKVISSKTPLISVTSTLIRDDRFENIGGNTWRIKDSVREVDEKS